MGENDVRLPQDEGRLPAGLSAAGGGVGTATGANYPYAAIPESYGGTTNWYRTAASRLAEDSQGEINVDDAAPDAGDEDDLDNEAENDPTAGGGIRKLCSRVYEAVFGSITVLVMNLTLGVVIIVRCCMGSTREKWVGGGIVFGTAVALSFGVLLIRFCWIKLILKPFFPERRTLNLLTWFLDPEFGTLIWTIATMLFFTGLFEKGTSGAVGILHDPSLRSLTRFDPGDYNVYYYTLIFLCLWAARDVLVKTIMLKLMLGFLTNFNAEVVQFLHRYSQIRRLNAAWVKLIPSSDVTDNSGGASFLLAPDMAVNEEARQSSIPPLLTLASINEVENPKERAKRQREYSKQRLRAIAHINKSMSKQNASRIGSKMGDMDFKIPTIHEGNVHHLSLEMDKSRTSINLVDNPPPVTDMSRTLPNDENKGSKWNFEFTAGQKRRREREYHVDFTGRALPRLLEVKSILDTQKSRLSNLLAINWIREQPVVIFVDGQRCEVESKAQAKHYGQQLFETLLNFRQTLLDVEEEEKALLTQNNVNPQYAPAQALHNIARRRSTLSSSAGGAASQDQPHGPPERDASTPLVSSVSLSQSSGSEGSVPFVERSITRDQIYTHQFEDDADHQSRPRRVELCPPTFENIGRHEAEPPSHRQHWMRRRGVADKSSGAISNETSRWYADQSPKSAARSWHKGPPTDAQLAAITAAEIRKVKLQMPDDRDCLTEDFFELFMSISDAKQLCQFLDPASKRASNQRFL